MGDLTLTAGQYARQGPNNRLAACLHRGYLHAVLWSVARRLIPVGGLVRAHRCLVNSVLLRRTLPLVATTYSLRIVRVDFEEGSPSTVLLSGVYLIASAHCGRLLVDIVDGAGAGLRRVAEADMRTG